MKLSFQMVVWLIICGLCASLATGVCRADNVESVINNITAARNKIDSYHLKIVQETLTSPSVKRPNEKPSLRKLRFEIWNQGEKRRLDSVVIESTDRDETPGERTVRCRNCEKKGHILRTMHRQGALTPVTFQAIDSYSPATDDTDVNWPWLGLSNNVGWPWFAFPQNEFLNAFLMKDESLILPVVETMEAIHGTSCRRFTLNGKKEKRQASLWVDPARDGMPIRLENSSNEKIILSTVFTYPTKPADRIWFPEKVEQLLGGKAGTSNTYVIELAEFNRRIPDAIFSYGGLNLPDDMPVLQESSDDVMRAPRLRNGKLVSSASNDKGTGDFPGPGVAIPDKPPTNWLTRSLYLLGAFVLALIGIRFARRVMRSGKE